MSDVSFLAKCLIWAVVFLFPLNGSLSHRDTRSHRFGYARNRQELWQEDHKKCGGKYQSPIQIVRHRAIPLALRAVEMVGYHDPLPGPLNLTNNGHSVMLRPEGLGQAKHPPAVYGAVLKDHYIMDTFHFHWGLRDYRGSEHRVNGIRYPMEMHIVHRKQSYSSVQEAMNHPDGLTVLAFFFQVREKDNSRLQPLVTKLHNVTLEGQSVHLDYKFTMASLLPQDREIYYTYRGSLTTPPCSEVVTWIVFPEPQFISYNQLKQFRRLSSSESKIADNYRILQHLGNRLVYVRKMYTNRTRTAGGNFTHGEPVWYH